jgi:hypothetical protein
MHASNYSLAVKSIHALVPHVASPFDSITNQCTSCSASALILHRAKAVLALKLILLKILVQQNFRKAWLYFLSNFPAPLFSV